MKKIYMYTCAAIVLILTAIYMLYNSRENDTGPIENPEVKKTIYDMQRPDEVDQDVWEHFIHLFDWRISNNAPINFYARVVDQDNNPVQGAKVTVHYNYFVESLQEQWKTDNATDEIVRHVLTSDSEGRVQLTEGKGAILYIDKVVKNGYIYPAATYASLHYSKSENEEILPTPKKPYIIRVWRKSGNAAATTLKEFTIRPNLDGTKNCLDLVSAKRTTIDGENVDIIVEMTAVGYQDNRTYDWQISLTCPSGGLVEADGRMLYLAPESGYQKKISWKVAADDPSFSRNLEKCLYLHLRNRQIYCAMRLSIYAYHTGNGRVGMDYVINDSGSRDLAHDNW